MLNPMMTRADFVRPLTPDTRVNAASAFIDRFELSVGDWALFGEEDAICSSMNEFRNEVRTTARGDFLPVFRGELIRRRSDFGKLKFANNPTTDSLTAPGILVSGTCQTAPWGYNRTPPMPNEQARIRFRTQLNLTRFIQAQGLKRINWLGRPAISRRHVLEIQPDPSWYADEIPLAPATNIVIGPNRKYAYALKADRPDQFRLYTRLVNGMLSDVVNHAFDGSEVRAVAIPQYTLHSIEFYWEFDQPSAIDYVVGLRPQLLANSYDVTEDHYPVDLPSLQITGQSPSYKIKLTKFMSLKIYAKTNRRVRFEVSFKDDAINKFSKAKRSSDTLVGIAALLPNLAAEAARRVNILLQSIASGPVPPSDHTALQLLHIITREAGHPYVAETIISALVAFGRVALFRNEPLREAVHRLRDAKVLKTNPAGSSKYVVTEPYREPLERLRQFR
jgi:hypothetical protein